MPQLHLNQDNGWWAGSLLELLKGLSKALEVMKDWSAMSNIWVRREKKLDAELIIFF